VLSLLAHLWCLPLTVVGMLLALPEPGGAVRTADGAYLVHAERGAVRLFLRWAGADACAIGEVCFFLSASPSARLVRHELEHVRQGRRWGITFPVAYVVAGCWQALRGRRWYQDNPFEVAARAAEVAR